MKTSSYFLVFRLYLVGLVIRRIRCLAGCPWQMSYTDIDTMLNDNPDSIVNWKGLICPKVQFFFIQFPPFTWYRSPAIGFVTLQVSYYAAFRIQLKWREDWQIFWSNLWRNLNWKFWRTTAVLRRWKPTHPVTMIGWSIISLKLKECRFFAKVINVQCEMYQETSPIL